MIIDSDLADIYGVETKILNKAVSRNRKKFPPDFAFRLTPQEYTTLRLESGTSKDEPGMRFQTGTASKRNVRYLPCVFTEHGAIMAANILRSPQAENRAMTNSRFYRVAFQAGSPYQPRNTRAVPLARKGDAHQGRVFHSNADRSSG